MAVITDSQKFQVGIPQKVRKMLNIQGGQKKKKVIAYDNRVVLIPMPPIQEASGSLKGMDTGVPREERDRDREL